jgi:ABC-type lipoprotein export system ATPase subunit
MNAVEASALFHFYATSQGTSVALQGLTLDVAERELLVVFGPSGSGKSTLLRILAGLERPSAGSISVFGHDLRTLRGRALAAYRSRTLGYADQHYARALVPELSARELVALRLGLLGIARADRLRRADALLERVGLLERKDARPAELSGGQQQRVALCAALAHGPRLFIADEPTGELDAENAAQVYALIGELSRELGATSIVVSHDPASAGIADRVVQIRDGRVSGERARDGRARAVVGRGGWIRLPEELVGESRRATVERAAHGILVRPDAVARAVARTTVPQPVEGPVVVRAEGLAKVHGRGARATTVFHDLGLELRGGRLAVVTGPSGSGKSTLLHILAGVDEPTAGSVLVDDVDLTALDVTARAALRRSKIGLVAQGTDLVPFLSAHETVELALLQRGAARADAGVRAAAALAQVGLGELAGQRVSRLSMGEKQRVAVARAVASRPLLLLADEPTARLDEDNARALGALLADVARSTGAAVVCATHDPAVVEHAVAEVPLARGLKVNDAGAARPSHA